MQLISFARQIGHTKKRERTNKVRIPSENNSKHFLFFCYYLNIPSDFHFIIISSFNVNENFTIKTI